MGDGSCVSVSLLNSSLSSAPVNCTIPFTLTLAVHSLDYPIGVNQVTLSGVGLFEGYNPLFGSSNGDSNASISFYIDSDPFALRLGVPLNLVVTDRRANWAATPPLPLFSLLPYPLPYIASVSGCQPPPTPSPLATLACYPNLNVLTLTGIGFAPIASFNLIAGNSSGGFISQRQMSPPTWGLTIVNDSQMLLALNSTGWLYLAERDYDGRPLSLCMSWSSGHYIGPFNISFADIPAPQITNWDVTSATRVAINATARQFYYVDARPGVSTLRVYGQSLYNLSMSIGGVQVMPYFQQGTTNYNFVLPAVEPYTPQLYDAVFSTASGQVRLPSAVAFTANASISGFLPCWDDGLFTYSWRYAVWHCQTNDTLTVLGSRLRSAPSLPTIVIRDLFSGGTTRACADPVIVSDSVLTCTMPTPPDSWVGGVLQAVGSWPDGAGLSTSSTIYAWDSDSAPRILSVAGCGGQSSSLTSGLALSGCHQGDVLHLTGRGFAGGSWIPVSATRVTRSAETTSTNFLCVNLTVLSDSSLTCAIPYPDEWADMQEDQPYSLILYPEGAAFSFGGPTFKGGNSNSISLTFGDRPPPPPTSDTASDGTDRSALVAGLTVGLVVLAAAVVAVVVMRWRQSRREQGEGLGEAKWWDRLVDAGRLDGEPRRKIELMDRQEAQ